MTTKKRAATAVDKQRRTEIKVEVWGSWSEGTVRGLLLEELEAELEASNPLIAKGVMDALRSAKWSALDLVLAKMREVDALASELAGRVCEIDFDIEQEIDRRPKATAKAPAPAKKKPTKKAKSKSAQKSAPKAKAPKAAPKAKLAGDLLKALHDLSSGARVAFEVNGTTLNALYKRGLIDLDNKLTAAGTEVVASGNGEARA